MDMHILEEYACGGWRGLSANSASSHRVEHIEAQERLHGVILPDRIPACPRHVLDSPSQPPSWQTTTPTMSNESAQTPAQRRFLRPNVSRRVLGSWDGMMEPTAYIKL